MKKAYFAIDDVIWVLRDLTRQKPASLFDNPFMKMLKDAHDRYGVKTQLNLFYRTDYAYGYDEFTLADMTDAYKAEWKDASDWLKLAFHSLEEFPDYPHINASYEDTWNLFKKIEGEVFRFAGEDSFAYGLGLHWNPISKAGTKALADCGTKLLLATAGGDVRDFDGDPSSLPYGHAFRLLQNRQPETKMFTRGGRDLSIADSICGYNHLLESDPAASLLTPDLHWDEETGLYMKGILDAITLNLTPYEELEEEFSPCLQRECCFVATHEQYFYEDYCAYQPDYADKIFKMGEILKNNGFAFIFIEELVQ